MFTSTSRKLKIILISVLCLIIMTSVASIAIYSWIKQIDISQLEDPLPEPTFVYDRHGQIVSQLSSAKFTPVSLEEMPPALIQAIIAVEDRRFYEHEGVDVWAIARSFFTNVKAGDTVQGGSTITQQLAKTLFLSSEKTYKRKIQEAGIAIKIDLTYSKEEILELYLNQIYFGEGTWGVEEAAQTYFGKPIQELTLVESALLAALPKAPTHYSPIANKEKALERRNLVLSLMKEQKYISEEEYKQAIAEPIAVNGRIGNQLKGKYASYVDYVMEEAVSKYGFTEEQLLTGGLHIYTHLDTTVQNVMEDVFQDEELFSASNGGQKEQIVQSGTVVLDPYTGGIQGLMGHRGDHVFRGLNRATQVKRQPGSTFKPLAVYAPALEAGYTPFSMLYDGPLNLNGYQPRNWDNQTRGQVTLYEAVVKSWNIPAVWLLNEIGLKQSLAFLEKTGISLTKEDQNLSLALGGLNQGVSPLEMAQAYSIFPNLGELNEAHAITRITTKDGHVLVEAKPRKEQVLSPANAYMMTLLLQEVVREGTGKRAAFDRPIAGKTGTTQLPATREFSGLTGAKDAWFVGYTPELVTAVWVGYDRTDANHYLSTSGGNHPALIFREIMSRALQDAPVKAFVQPENFRVVAPPQEDTQLSPDQPADSNKHQEKRRKFNDDDVYEQQKKNQKRKKRD